MPHGCMITAATITIKSKNELKNLKKDSLLCPQVRLVSELGKIEGSLQELNKMKVKNDVGQYSIEVIELF